MKRVICIGMVGKLPTPEGSVMFYDIGRKVSPAQLNEVRQLLYKAFSGNHKTREEARKRISAKVTEIAKQVNVYPVGKAMLVEDGRILVTESYFNEKEAGEC